MCVKCGVGTVVMSGGHTVRALRRLARRRPSRGQAMVEFALVAPLFFLLLFGFIEYALISTSIAAFNFAAKDGARIGSLLGRTDGTVDTQILNSVNQHVAGIVMAKPVTLEIYKSDAAGDYLLPGNTTAIEDSYSFSSSSWTAQNWLPSLRDDTLINADYLGVKITYQYTYLSAFVSGGNSTLQLTASAVERIEPQDFQSRRSPPSRPFVALAAPEGVPALGGGFGGLPGAALLAQAVPDMWASMWTDVWMCVPCAGGCV